MRARKIWYSVSCLFSVQYRNWESKQRTFKVAVPPKRRCVSVCDWARNPQSWQGGWWGGWVATPVESRLKTAAVSLRWKKRFSGSVWYHGGRSRRKSRSLLTLNKNVNEPRKKKLKYNQTSLAGEPLKSTVVTFVQKMALIRRGHCCKLAEVRQCYANTRRAWATN